MTNEINYPDDSYARLEEAQKRYLNTEKGKSAVKRYQQSPQGREAQKRYFESEQGKAALLRYYLSEKAQTQRERRKSLNKLFRRLDNYLNLNQDKTIEDFFAQLGEDRR